GVDPMDASKSTFGSRGTFIPVLGLLYVVCAWEAVVTAFIARGGSQLLASASSGGSSRQIEIVLALVVVIVSWLIVRRGSRALEKVNNVVGPGLLLLSVVLLVLLARHTGAAHLWTGAAPVSGRMTNDPHIAFISAIELGIGASFGNWPFMGGLLRQVRYRRHVVLPSMIGLTIVGLGFGGCVAAMVAVELPDTNPLAWILALGGKTLGTAIIVAMLLGNVAVVGLLSYFGAIALQQMRLVAQLRWDVIVALTLIPAVAASCNADATLSAVTAIANYQGMCIVGIAAVTFSDYFLLRRQKIDVVQLYVRGPEGRYWFWRGINWIAVCGVLVAAVIYRLLYNPATLAGAPAFRWLGASIPAFIAGAIFHAGVTKIVVRFIKVGGYDAHVRRPELVPASPVIVDF
ncbi:MAG: cytosine permease, partial [Janthinobacterium lividum]